MQKVFLSARWEQLILANYVVDPHVLEPFVPAGTELDLWEGRAYVSLVGFLFLDTRVLGVPIPFHRNFEEVNLRFYVRRLEAGEWKRGVVFIREIVPRRAIAAVANSLYKEHYLALGMKHEIDFSEAGGKVQYQWRYRGRWNSLGVEVQGQARPMEENSEAEFIAEHYWGYTRIDERRTGVYQVEHPRWNIFTPVSWDIDCDFRGLYGAELSAFLEKGPDSIFLARGSEVNVRKGVRLRI